MKPARHVRTWPLAALLFALSALAQHSAGPPAGALVVVGGGAIGPEIVQRFVELAGGPDSEVVFVPTAGDGEPSPQAVERFKKQFGLKNATTLHTRDPKVADSVEFCAPLRRARAVFFAGGRQWRLADSYLGTRAEREFRAVLERGGVIAGSSAGATIQGSYLVRGAVEGNTVMMSKGHEAGFGYLKNVAVDQHIIARKREGDLAEVIRAHPEILGIGIDESTAIVVQGDRFEVIGVSKVAITDGKDHGGKPFYFLEKGQRFDLRNWRKE